MPLLAGPPPNSPRAAERVVRTAGIIPLRAGQRRCRDRKCQGYTNHQKLHDDLLRVSFQECRLPGSRLLFDTIFDRHSVSFTTLSPGEFANLGRRANRRAVALP